jgi:hypothetical protein
MRDEKEVVRCVGVLSSGSLAPNWSVVKLEQSVGRGGKLSLPVMRDVTSCAR